jgi:hypothetical protein
LDDPAAGGCEPTARGGTCRRHAALTEAASDLDSPRSAHFMAMCSKLVYEDARVIEDVVVNE